MGLYRIPIFPLHTVLFPGMLLTLRIFEPRYVEMLERCLADGEAFGVCLIRSGSEVGEAAEPFEVGTVCRIIEHTPAGDQQFLLKTVGAERFRIVRLYHDAAYLEADVEPMEDLDRDESGQLELLPLAREVSEKFFSLLESYFEDHAEDLATLASDAPTEPLPLSFWVGALLPCAEPVRQDLLEAPRCRERLELERDLISQVKPLLQPRHKVLRYRRMSVNPDSITPN